RRTGDPGLAMSLGETAIVTRDGLRADQPRTATIADRGGLSASAGSLPPPAAPVAQDAVRRQDQRRHPDQKGADGGDRWLDLQIEAVPDPHPPGPGAHPRAAHP